jgi:predicted Zn finger-like uncharacterized protein
MNRITRCPSCATVYQVGDAQLQQARGWLRCSHCAKVFDSTGLVLAWSPPAASVIEVPAHRDFEQGVSPVLSHRTVLDDSLQLKDRERPVDVPPVADDLAFFEEALSNFKPDPLMSGSASGVDLKPSSQFGDATRLSKYLALSLAMLLVLQVVFVQRHAIVADWPQTGPLIRRVCQSLGCLVSPLRDAEALVIESSSFIHRSQDHALNWTVRNTSSRTLGMTALELSLMQGPENVLMRRVFRPEETGAPELLAPGQSWSGRMSIQMEANLIFSDYLLMSFYP